MIVRTAFRELRTHATRTGFAIAGVAVATAMLLDMLMLAGGLQVSFEDLLRSAGYQLRVSPSGTLPFDSDATIESAGELISSLSAHPDVEQVAPLLAANLRSGPDGADRVFALGVDPEAQGVFRLVEGALPLNEREVVVGRTLEREGLSPGDTIRLSPPSAFGRVASGAATNFRISGVGEFLYTSSSERPVAVRLADLQEIARRHDQVSFLMLRAPRGADEAAVADRLSLGYPGVEVVAIGDLVDQADERLSYFRQLAIILGSVSLVVTALLVGTIAAVSMNDRFGPIAAVRALGISRRSILATLLTESLLLSSVAAAIGLGLGIVTAGYLETILGDFPGLPEAVQFFVLQPGMLRIALVALFATALIATVIPALRVANMPIATTLHREEP